jgi:hypothetical protein
MTGYSLLSLERRQTSIRKHSVTMIPSEAFFVLRSAPSAIIAHVDRAKWRNDLLIPT